MNENKKVIEILEELSKGEISVYVAYEKLEYFLL